MALAIYQRWRKHLGWRSALAAGSWRLSGGSNILQPVIWRNWQLYGQWLKNVSSCKWPLA